MSNFTNLVHVIPSRKRAESLKKGTLQLFPNAYVVIDRVEYDDYAKYIPKSQLVTHPSLAGLPAIRNFIIREFESYGGIVMIDDDVYGLRSRVGKVAHSYRDPEVAAKIVWNSYVVCNDLGIPAWSYELYTSVIGFSPHNFISFTKILSTVVGVLPPYNRIKWDENFRINGDVDATMQYLMRDRIIFIDGRFEFENSGIFKGRGGNAIYRTKETIEKNKQMLKNKWGRYINFSTNKGSYRTHVKVQRKGTK